MLKNGSRQLSLILTVLIASLTACGGGGEPSEDDISDAMRRTIESRIASNSALNSDNYKIYSISKKSCVSAGDKAGYNCDVEIDAEQPMIGRRKATQSLRFIHTDDGWTMTQ